MKFLVPNYSCLQNPWLGGHHPQIPVPSVLCFTMSLSGNIMKKTARWCHAARKWNLLQIITYLFNSHFCSSVPKHNLFHPMQFVPVVLILMHELWKKTRKNIFIWEVFHPLRTFTSFTTLPSTVLPSTSVCPTLIRLPLPSSLSLMLKVPSPLSFYSSVNFSLYTLPSFLSFCLNFQLSLLSHTITMTTDSLSFPRILENSAMCLYQVWHGLDITYEEEPNENLKSAITIRNTARLSCKLTTVILMVWRVAERWQ